jgi:hypothetical protein
VKLELSTFAYVRGRQELVVHSILKCDCQRCSIALRGYRLPQHGEKAIAKRDERIVGMLTMFAMFAMCRH